MTWRHSCQVQGTEHRKHEIWKSWLIQKPKISCSLFSASLDRTEDWRTEAASTPSKTLQRPGPGRWLRSTICARWTRFSHVIWFLPVWCCKNLIWLRSRPQVVGDGNFAVVRVCYSRLTRKEFAVKIIDKVRAYSHHHSTFFFLSFLS